MLLCAGSPAFGRLPGSVLSWCVFIYLLIYFLFCFLFACDGAVTMSGAGSVVAAWLTLREGTYYPNRGTRNILCWFFVYSGRRQSLSRGKEGVRYTGCSCAIVTKNKSTNFVPTINRGTRSKRLSFSTKLFFISGRKKKDEKKQISFCFSGGVYSFQQIYY